MSIEPAFHPFFSENAVLQNIKTFYGISGTLRALPGEVDKNYHLISDQGAEFVFKIAHPDEKREHLDFQNKAFLHLAQHAPDLSLPRLIFSADGQEIVTLADEREQQYFARLLTYVPGDLWAHVNPHTDALLVSLGKVLGRIDQALQNFDHSAVHRGYKWDVAQAAWIRDYQSYIASDERRQIVARFLQYFLEQVQPKLPALRQSVTYNDANDYNVLVSEDRLNRQVIGVIDFGDMVYTNTVTELAIACAYAMMDKPDPLSAACSVVSGYHSVFPLSEAEIELLFPLICTRLCVTVTNAAYQKVAEPKNEYLTISERPAWGLLEKLSRISLNFATCAFRDACGLEPCDKFAPVTQWLRANQANFASVLDCNFQRDAYQVFDFSVGSVELGNAGEFSNIRKATRTIFNLLEDNQAKCGVGKYAEARSIYTTDSFKCEGNEGSQWRTVHLGIDLFQSPGSPVFAPLDGIVHRVFLPQRPLSSGPKLILEHRIDTHLSFYTMYGHLQADSVKHLSVGQRVVKNELIARIGDSSENGGWTPHLHFQIVLDLLTENEGFPGVCLPSQKNIWLSLAPDPNLLLNIPALNHPSKQLADADIHALRQQYFGKNLSISYQKPLHIARGYLQYLYNDEGQAFLDTVNNVPHVGHCHPKVVAAGQRQMAALNTNTRYLHRNLVEFAERLCAKLPEPLRVCFFVNSGSEANELALRLARNYTGQKDTVVVEVGYHGNTNALIEISSYKFDGPGGKGAQAHIHPVPIPDVYRGLYRRSEPDAGKKYAAHIKTAIDHIQQNGRNVSAFICEPIISCGGQIVLPENYLNDAYRYVRDAGGVCIADEVQVGFGRVGSHFWAFEMQGVVPDIVTMGKPIGNGHPLAAVVTTRPIAEAFANGMEYFNTFGGNPVSCAIGMAVLDVMEQEQLQAHAKEVGAYLTSGLNELMTRYPIIGDVRGPGLFLGFEMVTDRAMLQPAEAQASYLINRMRAHGILMSTDGTFHNVIKIKPPMPFSKQNADVVIATLDKVLKEDFLRV